tara:strand:- start:849 stop:1037 length:189 start_codon:yes stop_codon:yes gene_type:complete
MKLSQEKLLDIIERAYRAGCFDEVLKMIKAGSPIVMIEQVIKKSKNRLNEFDFFSDDFFGAD